IDRLDRLDEEYSQVIHGARADAAVQKPALLADLVAIVFQVRHDRATPHAVDGVDDLRQMQFYAALLAQWSTRRTPGRSFDTTAAHMFLDLVAILVQFHFR